MSAPDIRNAEEAFHRGDLGKAASICDRLLRDVPDHPAATLLTALIAARRKRTAEAIPLLRKALTLSPNDYVALTWLQTALRIESQFEEAIDIGERARNLWPKDVPVLVNLSHAYLGIRDIHKAASCLEEAVATQPGDAALHHRLGIACELLARDEHAAREFRKSIELDPHSEDAYIRLGGLLMGHGNFTQVLDLCQGALERLTRSAQLHLLQAQALRALRQEEAARESLAKAIDLNPETVLSAALWLNEDGEFDAAAKLFRRSIEQRPNQGVAYFGLVKGKKINKSDRPLIDRMQRLLDEGALPPKERAALCYALGKAADDLGEYESAMSRFDEGNALNHRIYLSGKAFETRQAADNISKIAAMFTPDFMECHGSLGSTSEAPIFVVGMIRSGTTLVEQVLASHPEVGAAGEQRFWVNELPKVIDLDSAQIGETRFIEARERYLKVLRSFQPDTARVTDKMPLNFYCLGPIRLAFPNAKIVHVMRHPVDTALSIYMTDLSRPPDFAHDKGNIVAEYRNYLQIMRHWRCVIPSHNLLEISYEELVSNQEKTTRILLEFIGLPWNPACLNFHETIRPVATPSMWQVRQPIYRTSIEKWRRYEPHLGAFASLFGDVNRLT